MQVAFYIQKQVINEFRKNYNILYVLL